MLRSLKDWQPTSTNATDDTQNMADDSQGDDEEGGMESSEPGPIANEPKQEAQHALGDAVDSVMEYQLNQLEEHLPEQPLPGPDRPQILNPEGAASPREVKPCEPPRRPVSTPCRANMQTSQDYVSSWVEKIHVIHHAS